MKRILTATAVTTLLTIAQTQMAMAESRTAGRQIVDDNTVARAHVLNDKWANYEKHMFNKRNRHPKQWDGMSWNPNQWPEDWPKERVLYQMYDGKIFHHQYIKRNMPVVEVGPTFYKLSDLDRQRSLELLTNYYEIFSYGFQRVQVKDWRRGRTIGYYSSNGYRPR